MAGLNKTFPCQLDFLPQVCQLLTIHMCTILLPGRALSNISTSPWDTKRGPGRDCPPPLDQIPAEPGGQLSSLRKGSKPTEASGQEEEKRRTNFFFPPNFFQHPNLLRWPQQAPPPRLLVLPSGFGLKISLLPDRWNCFLAAPLEWARTTKSLFLHDIIEKYQ